MSDVERALALVKDVAAGRITPDDSPWVFDDDLLYLAVRRLELSSDGKERLVALLAEVTDADGRARVIECLADPTRIRPEGR